MFAFASEIFPFMICFLRQSLALSSLPSPVNLSCWVVVSGGGVLGSPGKLFHPSFGAGCWPCQASCPWLKDISFLHLSVSCHSLLACRISAKESADSLMGSPLMVSHCISLSTFEIPSSLIFDIWIMCHSVGLLRFTLLGTVWAFWPGWLFPSLDWGSFPFLLFK